MHSTTLWQFAARPNYTTNIDLVYPYSETPYLGQYNLVKLPLSLNEPVEHVDYWGEGRIQTQHGTSGFNSCYNVNHTYQLVSNGPDRDKKIPNRIPVYSYTQCDTSAYIRDNSVLLVTVMGAPINTSCADDIVRMVNNDLGKVIVYGFDISSKEISNLTTALATKSLFICPNYALPGRLEDISLFNSHIAFLNVTLLKEELFKHVTGGLYDDAVNITKKLDDEVNAEAISDLVSTLLKSDSTTDCKLMSFAYKLWNSDCKDVVRNNFPTPFKLIFGQDNVRIINKGYNQALKLNAHKDQDGDRIAWGDKNDMTSKRVKWQFIPVWSNNDVTFKLHNIDYDMYLKLDATADSMFDRPAWGSTNSNEERHQFYVEPYMKDGNLIFYIINRQFRQGLKLAVAADSDGDRKLFGHNGDIYKGVDRYRWIISAWCQ